MTERPPYDPAAALELASLISAAHLDGKPSALVAAALAELLSRLLINYDEATAGVLLKAHMAAVLELNKANRAALPKDWRRKRYGHIP